MNIGWIGLGTIGTAMVKQLRAADHAVTVFTRGTGLADAVAAGAAESGDYRALAAENELLVLCVYDDAQVRAVMIDSGALAVMPAGSTLVVHTTGSPKLARELAELAPAGVDVLDVTFSGAESDAEAGTLTLMVGGSSEALERVQPALEAYGNRIFHVGGPGFGQVVKLLNNLLLGTNLMNASEALRLAESYGLEPLAAARVIQASSGASGAMNVLLSAGDIPFILNASRPYLEKDVATAMTAAGDAGLDVSLFQTTAAYYRPA